MVQLIPTTKMTLNRDQYNDTCVYNETVLILLLKCALVLCLCDKLAGLGRHFVSRLL